MTNVSKSQTHVSLFTGFCRFIFILVSIPFVIPIVAVSSVIVILMITIGIYVTVFREAIHQLTDRFSKHNA